MRSSLSSSPPHKEAKLIQAALYARVSTEMQEKERTIQSQLAAIAQYAEQHGFRTTPALTYTDEGFSGSQLDRPALDALRDHAREGRFDVVVILCPDRLARKYAYQALLLEELSSAGVEVHFCERPISDSPDDQLLLQIQGVIAEYERAKIVERARRGRLHRARMGELAPGNLPYGYRRAAKRHGGDGQIEIDEEEAVLVRQVFEWYVEEGVSIHAVATRLYDTNWRNRAGTNEWSVSTLSRMLRREWYTGKAYYNRSKEVHKPRSTSDIPSKRIARITKIKRPRAEWIEVAVPPIIDEELFRRAQQRLAHNRSFARRRLKHDEAFLLRGLVKCGLCGYAYTGLTRKQRLRGGEDALYHFYVCNRRSNRPFGAVGERCRAEPIRADDGADQVVWSTVRDLLLDSDALSQELSAWIERATTTTPQGDAHLERAEARLHQLERQGDRLTDAYQAGALPLEIFRRRMDALEDGRLTAQHTLAELKAEQLQAEAAHNRASSAKEFVNALRPKLNDADFHTRQTILRLLVERVIVTGKRLEIHLALPMSSNYGLTSSYHVGGQRGDLVAEGLHDIGRIVGGDGGREGGVAPGRRVERGRGIRRRVLAHDGDREDTRSELGHAGEPPVPLGGSTEETPKDRRRFAEALVCREGPEAGFGGCGRRLRAGSAGTRAPRGSDSRVPGRSRTGRIAAPEKLSIAGWDFVARGPRRPQARGRERPAVRVR
ncbi:MAG: recombinase family protein [Longimicrobiales bacterium]|nr:recombinase family protein [Longimicrobiales bacterium]